MSTEIRELIKKRYRELIDQGIEPHKARTKLTKFKETKPYVKELAQEIIKLKITQE